MPSALERYKNLIQENKNAPKRFDFVKNESENTTHLYLYGVIDEFWGVNANEFVQTLNSIETDEIIIHINSPGGMVFDGQSMASAIKKHSSVITAVIEGVCASAATFIASACDEVQMDEDAYFMIHNAWSFVVGNKNDMLQEAGVLEKIDGNITNIYARKTGKSEDEIISLLDAETWYTATEAKEAGFVDKVIESEDEKSDANNLYNLEAYEHTPEQLKNQTKKTTTKPKPPENNTDKNREPATPEPNTGFLHAQAKAKAALAVSR